MRGKGSQHVGSSGAARADDEYEIGTEKSDNTLAHITRQLIEFSGHLIYLGRICYEMKAHNVTDA